MKWNQLHQDDRSVLFAVHKISWQDTHMLELQKRLVHGRTTIKEWARILRL